MAVNIGAVVATVATANYLNHKRKEKEQKKKQQKKDSFKRIFCDTFVRSEEVQK